MTTKYRPHSFADVPAALMAAFAFCSLAAGTAQARTYKYTGLAYTQVLGGGCITSSMYVTISFSVAGKLPANAASYEFTPVNWRMSNGVNHASGKTQPNTEAFLVSTDSHSNIIAWDIGTYYYTKKGLQILIGSVNEPALGLVADEALDDACKAGASTGESFSPGSW